MKKLIKISSGLLVIIIILFGVVWFSGQDNNLQVYFFDVGQGDAMLIRTPSHQNIIIDGGPDNSFITKLGQTLPFYDKSIDLMILTHPHDDHIYGLVEVLKRYEVKQVLYTGVLYSTEAYLELLEIIKEKEIPLTISLAGQEFIFNEAVLKVIFPFDDFINVKVENLNNSSIVVKLIYNKVEFIFMGDLEIDVEDEIIEAFVDELQSQVIKLGHHGSDTSTSAEFLEAVNPDFAVIQVGEDNKFGHPSRRIIKRLERQNIKILRNDLLGDIRLFSDGHKIIFP